MDSELASLASPLGAFPGIEELIRYMIFVAGAAYGATQIVRSFRNETEYGAKLRDKYPKYSRWSLRLLSVIVGVGSAWWMMRNQWAIPVGMFSGAFSSTIVKYGKRIFATKAGVTLDDEDK